MSSSSAAGGAPATEDGSREFWVHFDGPVLPSWVESLNSVLDDTAVLTLANGDRLPVHPGMRFIFEAADLRHASPATVSRLGVMSTHPKVLTWQQLVVTWLGRLPTNTYRERMLSLFSRQYAAAIAAVEPACPTQATWVVLNILSELLRMVTDLPARQPRIESHQPRSPTSRREEECGGEEARILRTLSFVIKAIYAKGRREKAAKTAGVFCEFGITTFLAMYT